MFTRGALVVSQFDNEKVFPISYKNFNIGLKISHVRPYKSNESKTMKIGFKYIYLYLYILLCASGKLQNQQKDTDRTARKSDTCRHYVVVESSNPVHLRVRQQVVWEDGHIG